MGLGNMGKVFLDVESGELRSVVRNDLIDMDETLTEKTEEAETVITDFLNFNHLYWDKVRKIVLINPKKPYFESVRQDINELKPDVKLSSLQISFAG